MDDELQGQKSLTRSPTSISVISDDLLREIFLRLPTLPSLVRATLTCKSWYLAIRCSPKFRRHFRCLHPPPLLGIFFEPDGSTIPEFPTFVPAHSSDTELAAIVRGGDFFLTLLPQENDKSSGWCIRACYDGYLLLENRSAEMLAIFNPLTRHVCVHNVLPFFHGPCEYFLFPSVKDPGSLKIIGLPMNDLVTHCNLFSNIKSCHPLLYVNIGRHQSYNTTGMQVKRFVYWSNYEQSKMARLDMAKFEISIVDLPAELKDEKEAPQNFQVGETKDGVLCIVCAFDFLIVSWLREAGNNGVEKWVLDRVVPMEAEVGRITGGSLRDHRGLKVVGVRDGFAYLTTMERSWEEQPPFFLSLCLENMKLEKLFQKRYNCPIHLYVMAWPPSLTDNGGNFGPEDAPEMRRH